MIFFRRYKHNIPKFPPTVAPTFKSLCQTLSEEEVKELEPQVDHCLEDFETMSKDHPNMNVELARELAERCRYLLAHYPEYGDADKALIMGAVRYFAIADDPLSEAEFASGFDDDARVMNHVLERLGLEDLIIRLR